jgi:hypothetical protein
VRVFQNLGLTDEALGDTLKSAPATN